MTRNFNFFKSNLSHHLDYKRVEYFLSTFNQLADLTGFYDTKKRISLIENNECKNYIHSILALAQKKIEEICYWLDKTTEAEHINIKGIWLNLYQTLEKKEQSITNTEQFKTFAEKDKQFILATFSCLKNGCIDTPKNYLSLCDYVDKKFKKLLKQVSDIAPEKPSCFICYAWMENGYYKKWINKFVNNLITAGIDVIHDTTHNSFGSIENFIQNIKTVDYIIIVGSPELLWKWQHPENRIVSKELNLIKNSINTQANQVVKVLFSGNPNGLESFPDFLTDYSHHATDCSNPNNYQTNMFNLLEKLYEKNKMMVSYLHLAKKLLSKEVKLWKNKFNYHSHHSSVFDEFNKLTRLEQNEETKAFSMLVSKL